MEKSIICIGKGGLGRAFERKGISCIGKEDLDITNINAVNNILFAKKPKYIINCAGIVGINYCKNNISKSYFVNVGGSINLAYYCKENNCKLIQISTIYSGDGNPYARTKYLSEKVALEIDRNNLVIRIPWLFGIEVDNYITRAMAGDKVSIYGDERCYLSYDNDIVDFVLNNIDRSGNISIANSGIVTRKEILDFIGANYSLIHRENPISDYILIDYYMRDWQEALKEFIYGIRTV